jgi:very-short-patch-repair endonuclease
MSGLHNNPRSKKRRRKLRRALTPAEASLWKFLKNSKLDGRKFRRQHSVGPYTLDFYCVEEWLAVELDGESIETRPQKRMTIDENCFSTKTGYRYFALKAF